MNQKGFSNIILVVIALVVLAGTIGYFALNKKSEIVLPENQQQMPDKTVNVDRVATAKTIASNYGFSFSVPNGWHLWEGYSAALNLMEKEGDNFVSSYEAGWTQEQINTYQEFLNSWIPEDAKVLVFTDAAVNYKNRNFSEAGKIVSTVVDSDDMLKHGATEVIISSTEINLEKETVSNNEREVRYIDIGSKKAFLQIGKKFEFVDMIIIQTPINTSKYIDGENVKSITFIKYVKKGDLNALPKLVSFISELNIIINP